MPERSTRESLLTYKGAGKSLWGKLELDEDTLTELQKEHPDFKGDWKALQHLFETTKLHQDFLQIVESIEEDSNQGSPEIIPRKRGAQPVAELKHQKSPRSANSKGPYLPGADLQGANLRDANLRNANLIVATLKGACLKGVDLQSANLERAVLDDADLQGVNLQGANLIEATFSGADLQRADLQGADLQGADLQGADLQGALLKGANLDGAQLQGVNLRGVDLQEDTLRGTNLQGANLQGANLQGADLQGADLQGVNLQGADLQGASLRKARADGANLFGATLDRADLRGASGWNLNQPDISCEFALGKEAAMRSGRDPWFFVKRYFVLPLGVILNTSGMANFVDNIAEGWIKWSDFFRHILDAYTAFIDRYIQPLFTWITINLHLPLPDWFVDYFVMHGLIGGCFVLALRGEVTVNYSSVMVALRRTLGMIGSGFVAWLFWPVFIVLFAVGIRRDHFKPFVIKAGQFLGATLVVFGFALFINWQMLTREGGQAQAKLQRAGVLVLVGDHTEVEG